MKGALAVALMAALLGACRSSVAAPWTASDVAPAHARPDGLPAAWGAWLGVDPPEPAGPVDWRDYFERYPESTLSFPAWRPGDGCLFELVQAKAGAHRRWFALVLPVPGTQRLLTREFTLTPDGEGESQPVPIPTWNQDALVTVQAVGGEPGVTRTCPLPVLAPGFGYPATLDDDLHETFAALVAEGGDPKRLGQAFATAWARGLEALISLFGGIQQHEELGPILESSVDKPSLFAILRAGGVALNLRPEFEKLEHTTYAIDAGPTLDCVRLPATVLANGKDALHVEIFAAEPVPPVHLTGGVLGLRASHPRDPERWVELRLIGARRLGPNAPPIDPPLPAPDLAAP